MSEWKTKRERAEESRRVFSNASEFKEGDHPRGSDGKFGSGGGGAKSGGEGEKQKASPKTPIKTRSKEDVKSMVNEFSKANQETTSDGKMTISKKWFEKGMSHYKLSGSPKLETSGENYIVSKEELSKFLRDAPSAAEKTNASSKKIKVYRAPK
jgi:hypothetical protein